VEIGFGSQTNRSMSEPVQVSPPISNPTFSNALVIEPIVFLQRGIYSFYV
jgi:hypothetical protein